MALYVNVWFAVSVLIMEKLLEICEEIVNIFVPVRCYYAPHVNENLRVYVAKERRAGCSHPLRVSPRRHFQLTTK